jgi:hypothetical protein
MMIGLPGSGKTYWAENWIKTHPEKKYMLLVRLSCHSNLNHFDDFDAKLGNGSAAADSVCV